MVVTLGGTVTTSSKSEQRRLRILVALAAYAYEIENEPIMVDHDYDTLVEKIDVSIDTGNKVLDEFFRKEFQRDTGMWIWLHPELHLVKQTYERFYKLEL